MIARQWRGWTTTEHADAYEALIRETIFPKLQRIEGARGGYLLRRDTGDGVELVTITLFDSMAAIRRFAGVDAEVAVVSPEARQLLTRFDDRVAHYEVVAEPS
ncbi:MAG: antibiotic biosynthesis monooxygenase [Chloroflexota bacterium]|nr:antibiotic biosynthesis monooxygenase [Chloroflexota bacterium]